MKSVTFSFLVIAIFFSVMACDKKPAATTSADPSKKYLGNWYFVYEDERYNDGVTVNQSGANPGKITADSLGQKGDVVVEYSNGLEVHATIVQGGKVQVCGEQFGEFPHVDSVHIVSKPIQGCTIGADSSVSYTISGRR